MIIAAVGGGLGNQLFQYAAARALANHHNVPLKLDISSDRNRSNVSFKLDNFNINVTRCSPKESATLRNRNFFNKAFQHLFPYHKRTPFSEPHFHFYPKFLKAPPTTYLLGLWQSEKYFLPIRDILLEEFSIKPALVSHLDEKAKVMRQESSISVHIRRGDYLSPYFLNLLGVLPEEYYLKAISLLLEKYPHSKIYFFSDDIKWVEAFVTRKKTFSHPHEFVTNNLTQTDIEDFYLMQQCKHNIIANSTFSWWAAWLNTHADKTVIAPKKWFNNVDFNYDDLVPVQWLVV
jgi:hypothetical protein